MIERDEVLERALTAYGMPSKSGGWPGSAMIRLNAHELALYLDQALDEAEVAAMHAAGQTVKRGDILTTFEDVQACPRGSALLCREGEVFWLPPGVGTQRVWLAAGYDPDVFSWDDAEVLDWAPVTVIHLGAGD